MTDCEARDSQDFCVSVDGTVAVCRVRLDTAFRMVTVEAPMQRAYRPLRGRERSSLPAPTEMPDATLVLLLEVAEGHARAMGLMWIRFLRFTRPSATSEALYRRMGFRCSRFGVAGSDIVVYEVAKRLRA